MADRDNLSIDLGDVSPAEIDQITQEQEITDAFTNDGGETNWNLQVWRMASAQNQKGQREAWLFRADVAEFPTLRERIQNDFGGGMYRVRVYKNNKLFKSSIWDIEPLPESKQKPATTAAVPAPAPDNQLMVLFAATMKPLFDQVQAMNSELVKIRGERTSRDPLDDLERYSAIIANLGAKQQTPSIDAQMTFFMKAFEFGRSVDGGGDKGDGEGLAGIFKTFMDSPIAKTAIEAMAAPKPAPVPLQRPAPTIPVPPSVVVTPPPANQATPAAPANTDTGQTSFAQLVNLCLGGAERGSDPALYADLLFDQLRDDEILALINNPNALDIAVIQYPAVGKYPEFFSGLVERLREIWMMQEPVGRQEHANGAGAAHAA